MIVRFAFCTLFLLLGVVLGLQLLTHRFGGGSVDLRRGQQAGHLLVPLALTAPLRTLQAQPATPLVSLAGSMGAGRALLVIDGQPQVLAYSRVHAKGTLHVAVNLGAQVQTYSAPDGSRAALLGWAPRALVITGRHHTPGALKLLREAHAGGCTVILLGTALSTGVLRLPQRAAAAP